MNRDCTWCALLAGLALVGTTVACEPPGVGDPCTPEVRPPPDPDRAGYNMPWAYGEVSVETRSLQCRTRTCMVYHFFPSGQDVGEPDWRINVGFPGHAWPDDEDPQRPCRQLTTDTTEQFVKHFCKAKRHDDGSPGYEADMAVPAEHSDWYCNFDMSLVNASRPFCTLKCGGAGRTFECPEGYACREVVTLGPEGMRGSYCVPSRLVDCEPNVAGEQDCCQMGRVW
ncbi:MAG: hypothetical protein HY905_05465 [Deltaproteobacteria bacterium]|nr:hypothetical protein [Deltaproteobacteria bacterium]